jgi:hypothetical protein
MTEHRRLQERFEPRLKSRLFAGLLVGSLVGVAIGTVVGFLVFEGRPGAVVASALAGIIAGVLYGTSVGSFAGLESPDPGNEPSETAHPLSDPAVEDEHEPNGAGESRGPRAP